MEYFSILLHWNLHVFALNVVQSPIAQCRIFMIFLFHSLSYADKKSKWYSKQLKINFSQLFQVLVLIDSENNLFPDPFPSWFA